MVYGFVTTRRGWQKILSYDGKDFCLSRTIHSVFGGMDEGKELWLKHFSDVVVGCMFSHWLFEGRIFYGRDLLLIDSLTSGGLLVFPPIYNIFWTENKNLVLNSPEKPQGIVYHEKQNMTLRKQKPESQMT